MEGLEHLRAAYLPRLGAQLDELTARLRAADVGESTRIAHKIAGAAGSYGLGEISAIARRVELALEDGASCDAQAADVDAMRAAIPVVEAPDDAPVILVFDDAATPAADGDVLVVADPVEALGVAMDRPLAALVIPYTGGARGGRALLRSLAGVAEVRDVPLFLVSVDPTEADAVQGKLGARAVFEGGFDDALLARVREALA